MLHTIRSSAVLAVFVAGALFGTAGSAIAADCTAETTYCIPSNNGEVVADPALENVDVPFTCPPASPTNCVGTLELRTDVSSRRKARTTTTIVIGSAAFNVPAGQTQTISVALNDAGKRLLGNATRPTSGGGNTLSGGLVVTPYAITTDANGKQTVQALSPITIKVLKRPSARKVTIKAQRKVLGAKATRYTISGAVLLPTGAATGVIHKSEACLGFIGLRFQSHGSTVSYRIVELTGSCSYKALVTFHVPQRFKRGNVTVSARWLGNQFLGGSRSSEISVKAPF